MTSEIGEIQEWALVCAVQGGSEGATATGLVYKRAGFKEFLKTKQNKTQSGSSHLKTIWQ